VIKIDMEKMTAEEVAILGEALGCEGIKETGEKIGEAMAYQERTGDIPLWFIVATVWVIKRQSDPTFTLTQARTMPVQELLATVETTDGPAPAAAPNRAARRGNTKARQK